MKFPILFSALALLVGCAAQSDNVEPALDEFKKMKVNLVPPFVNEYAYDAVFSVNQDQDNKLWIGTSIFREDPLRLFLQPLKKYPHLTNAFPLFLNKPWDDPLLMKAELDMDIVLNQVTMRKASNFYFDTPVSLDNASKIMQSLQSAKGFSWEIKNIKTSNAAKMSQEKASLFNIKKEGSNLMPDRPLLAKEYTFKKDASELVIEIPKALQNADVIYIFYFHGGFPLNIKEDSSEGLLKYFPGNATKFVLNKKELESVGGLEYTPGEVIDSFLAVSAYNYSSFEQNGKKILLRNSITTQSTVHYEK
jgi:hypothetical protein